VEKAKAFLEAVSADENLAKALSGIKSKEELLAFAARHGHNLTEQDLKDIAKIGSVYLKQKSGEPLSDEELELVSGGIVEWAIAVGIFFLVGAVTTAIGGALGAATLVISESMDDRS